MVDDDLSVRKSLNRLISSAEYKVKTFASAEEFLIAPPYPGPSCLVLDIKMPGVSGMELQKKLLSNERGMPIIFITGHGDIPMSVKAVKRGAVDFLSKPFDDKDLLSAIKEAIIRDAKARSKRHQLEDIHCHLELLTPREYEILTYVIAGILNKNIASILDISEKTVKAHRGRVMEKMGVDSVAELVRLTEQVNIKPAIRPL